MTEDLLEFDDSNQLINYCQNLCQIVIDYVPNILVTMGKHGVLMSGINDSQFINRMHQEKKDGYSMMKDGYSMMVIFDIIHVCNISANLYLVQNHQMLIIIIIIWNKILTFVKNSFYFRMINKNYLFLS